MTQINTNQQVIMMARNLVNNPLALLPPDVRRLAAQTGRIVGMGAEVSNSAAADKKLAGILGTGSAASAALSYADKFHGINNNVQGVLRTSMLNAGLHRENFDSDTQAVQALATKVAASDGNLAAVKTLGEVNVAQLNESIKLRDLLSTQVQAETAYMVGVTEKGDSKDAEKKKNDDDAAAYIKNVQVPPPIQKTKQTFQNWDMYSKKK